MKYFNIDYRGKYGHKYVVRCTIKGKNFLVWTGNNKALGEVIAKKVQELREKDPIMFLDWYDWERDRFIKDMEKKYE